MPQILVVDEHSIYRTGLCHLLRAGLPRVDVLDANDLNVALSQMRNRVFDLVLVGTGQSGSGTLDTLKTVREASPSTRFAIVSASDTRADAPSGHKSIAAGERAASLYVASARLVREISNVVDLAVIMQMLMAAKSVNIRF